MAKICVCTILPILSCVLKVTVLYSFTSTFVCTLSSGLILLALCVYLAELRCSNGNECLGVGLRVSCMFIGIGLVSGVTATCMQYGYGTTKCYFNECCDNRWIPSNITGLSLQLNRKLYGQHIAIGPVVKLLRGHVDSQPQKATVLSLHGLPGTGKNFLSRIVAENMYVKGMDSKFVHFLSATKDFPHEGLIEDYKDKLKQIIKTSVQECPQSFFIFDEMDKLLPGLIDTIRPYVDVNKQIDSTDYRQSLFMFLSNTGGDAIAEHVRRIYEQGSSRRKLSFKEMEEVVRTSALNDANGLFQSSIIKNSLVTAYIPFLPLERRHLKQCIVDGLFAKGFYEFGYQVDNDTVETIANEFLYFPNDTKTFSYTGCKRVMEKIDLVMQEDGISTN